MVRLLKNDVILVRFPFTDLSGAKVRPAVIISAPHQSLDMFIVPITSRVASLLEGEFILSGWYQSGLNVKSAIKRGIYTIESVLIIKKVGKLTRSDTSKLKKSLCLWLGLG